MLELRAHESLDLVREQPCRDEREEDGDWEGQGEGRGEKRRRRRKRNEPLDRTIERRRKQKKETAKIKRTDGSRLGLLHKLGSGRGRLCGRQGGEAAHVSESGRRSLFLKLDFFVVEGERVKTSIFFPLLLSLTFLSFFPSVPRVSPLTQTSLFFFSPAPRAPSVMADVSEQVELVLAFTSRGFGAGGRALVERC